MRQYIAAVEKHEGHVFRGQLSDVPIDDILDASRDSLGAQQQVGA
jgi:hypothetical protein